MTLRLAATPRGRAGSGEAGGGIERGLTIIFDSVKCLVARCASEIPASRFAEVEHTQSDDLGQPPSLVAVEPAACASEERRSLHSST